MKEKKIDTIAILYEKVKIRKNHFILKPVDVISGTIDTVHNNNFIYEGANKTYKVAPADSFEAMNASYVEKVYAYPIKVEKLEEEYPKVIGFETMKYTYYREFAEKITTAVTKESKVILTLLEEMEKKEEKEAPAVITKEIDLSYLKKIDNFALERYVKERVFEADDIIEDICTIIAMNYSAENKKEMKNMLSIGPTGSGKTMTYEVIADYLGIPLTIYDCNSLTSAGYMGKDIDDILREIYFNSKKKIDIAEKSIVVLDEVDKLAARGSDVKDVSVQQALLKFLEGYKYRFPIIKNGAEIPIDTSFMTIACLGAFGDLFDKKEFNAGFGSYNQREKTITDEDLIEYGMIKELVGRWKHLFIYKAQTEESLRKILLESKLSPLLLTKARYLRQFNAELICDESFIDAYIEEAMKSSSGGRSLSKINERTFVKVDRELLRLNNVNPSIKKKVLVTSDTIYDNKKFKI